MSTCAPFAISSKCVVRSSSHPDHIVEIRNNDDIIEENSTISRSQLSAAHNTSKSLLFPDGRAESGWISRNEEDESLFSQRSSSKSSKPESSSEKVAEDSFLIKLSRDMGLFPVVRRGVLWSLHDLPHPSKLRKKGGAGTKRSRETVRDEPVEKHRQQLKKKKDAYFTNTIAAAVSPSGELAELSTEQALPQTDVSISLTLPLLTSTAGEEAAIEIAAVPASQLPLAEEDEDLWFKKHWQSQLHKGANRLLEE